MSEFLLIFIAGLLVYLIYDREKEKKPKGEKSISDDSLKDMMGKFCEISLKDWLVYIDGDYTIKGVLKNMDEEWLVIEIIKKEKTKTKIIRKSLINDIKMIKKK